MRPKVQEPVEHVHRDGHGTTYTHPAFGMIGASRVQGDAVLVGSDLVHHNFIVLRVRHAELNRDLSRDWWFGKNEIVEVALSEAQWATMISSLNVGNGVPCKIGHVNGEQLPDVPHRQPDTVFAREIDDKLSGAVAALDKLIAAGGLTKAKLEELQHVRRELTSNLGFVREQFDRHVETTVERAKVEVNAYVTGVVARAGLAAIAETRERPIELLSAGDGSGNNDGERS